MHGLQNLIVWLFEVPILGWLIKIICLISAIGISLYLLMIAFICSMSILLIIMAYIMAIWKKIFVESNLENLSLQKSQLLLLVSFISLAINCNIPQLPVEFLYVVLLDLFLIWQIGRRQNWARWMILILYSSITAAFFDLLQEPFSHLSAQGRPYFLLGMGLAYCAFILLFTGPTSQLFKPHSWSKWIYLIVEASLVLFLLQLPNKKSSATISTDRQSTSEIQNTAITQIQPQTTTSQNSPLDKVFKATFPTNDEAGIQYLHTSVGVISVGGDEPSKSNKLFLDGKDIGLYPDHISLIGLYKNTQSEFFLFISQSNGTCCDWLPSLYIGMISNGKVEIKNIGIIHNGDTELAVLQKRVRILSDAILVDLDIWEKKHWYTLINADGSFSVNHFGIRAVGLTSDECEEVIKDLKECAANYDYHTGTPQFSNIQNQTLAHFENTRVLFSKFQFDMECRRVSSLGKDPDLYLVRKRICGL